MDQWLIRTKENWIAGPYSRVQVKQLILDGKLTIQDEVCLANHYWFFIHERNELAAQLGIDISAILKSDGDDESAEITETQLDDDDQKAQTAESNTEGTSVLDVSALRSLKREKQKVHSPSFVAMPKASPVPSLNSLQMEIRGRQEISFYKTRLFWGLCVAFVLSVFLFFYLFKI